MEGRKEGWVGGWMDEWMEGKAGLRIAYSNKKQLKFGFELLLVVQIIQSNSNQTVKISPSVQSRDPCYKRFSRCICISNFMA